MNIHWFRFALSILFLLLVSDVLVAQEDYDFYLQKARQRLAEGDCSRAEVSYYTYKDLAHKTNKEIERLIEECKNGGSNALSDETTSALGTANGHEWVDLGLPSGTLWATCNIGANKPEEYGNYYAWGEINTKGTYLWETYKYANITNDKLTKYCFNSDLGNNGFTDNLTTLQSNDDPATANWGKGWQTPSKEQWDELLENTSNQWTTKNNVKGRLFTSKKNGKTLFLPASGSRDRMLMYVGYDGYYWSRSLFADDPRGVWVLGFRHYNCDMFDIERDTGFSVRPVYQKNCTTTTKTVTRTRVVISGDSDEVIRAANKILNGD